MTMNTMPYCTSNSFSFHSFRKSLFLHPFSETVDCWDAPRTMDVREAYEKTVHCYRLSMRMLKLATYVVLSIGVLVTALISKGALLLMTNSVAKVQEVITDFHCN